MSRNQKPTHEIRLGISWKPNLANGKTTEQEIGAIVAELINILGNDQFKVEGTTVKRLR